MAQFCSFNRLEVQLLAKALNNSKISLYSPGERTVLAKVTRKLSSFLVDGSTEVERKPRNYKKKQIGFAKVRAEDTEWQRMSAELQASMDSIPVPSIVQRPPLPAVLSPEQLESVYATLRGERKLTK